MTACVMSLFQAAKMGLYPAITIRMSNLITIGFTAAMAAFVSFIVLRREERVRFELAASEEALRKSSEEYRLVFECCPLPMWVFEKRTLVFLQVNEAAVRHYGFSREEFLTMTIADIRPAEDVPSLQEAIKQSFRGLQEPELWRHRKKDGTLMDVEIVGHDLWFQGIEAEVVAAHDITRRKVAEEALRGAEERYRRIFEDAVVGIFQITPQGCPISINRAFAQIHGYESPDQFLREVPNLADKLFVRSAQLDELRRMVEHAGVVRDVELEFYRRDGGKRSVRVNLRGVRDVKGHLALIEGTVEDITDRKLAEEQVQFLAYYDALTGLPNRTLLHDRLEKALASARRRKEKVALLFLDLDRFKTFNDSLGHSFGDSILREVADRLKNGVREQDTVARIGGDEFLIMLKAIKDMPDVAVAAERMMDAMIPEFVVQGRAFTLSCSVGISVYPEHGADSETLIKNADAAMYNAKESGRNAIRVFAAEMNAQVMERLNIEHNLRLALKRKEFFLVYQPQINVATEEIVGLEALIRWQQPELGLVPPDRFIRIAENTGLILPIGEWTLREACSAARKWQEQGLPAVPVAVNVSAVQFRQEGFRDLVKAVLRETGLAPQYLELELTESLLLSTGGLTLPILQDLKVMGVKLAIDDFGTGYSSLSYLRYFPVNKLKIDRSFIQAAPANPDDAAIASAIISMAKSLNLKTLAEGVENEAQMSFLRACHCDEVQGYYFSKPLTFDQVNEKLSRAPYALTAP
jgi:diguanylate cyclase (GGDEF)-like protein/PAS domain S-box-containing protein